MLIKRIIIISICILLFLFISGLVFAAESSNSIATYKIDELNLEIQLPKDWIILTPDISKDDELITKHGINYDKMMRFFSEYNISFDAFSISNNSEMVITNELTIASVDTPNIYDIKLLSNNELQQMQDRIQELISDSALSISSIYPANINGRTYVVAKVTGEKYTGFLRYSTIVNNRVINFEFTSYSEIPLSISDVDAIMDSIQYTYIESQSTSISYDTQNPTSNLLVKWAGRIGAAVIIGGIVALHKKQKQKQSKQDE